MRFIGTEQCLKASIYLLNWDMMIRGRTSPPVPPWEWETAVRGSQGESFWVSRGARCGALRGKAVAKWCPHYTGISWALETPSFGASLKDGLLFCNRLPRLPSAVLGGSPQKKRGSAVSYTAGMFSLWQWSNTTFSCQEAHELLGLGRIFWWNTSLHLPSSYGFFWPLSETRREQERPFIWPIQLLLHLQ